MVRLSIMLLILVVVCCTLFTIVVVVAIETMIQLGYMLKKLRNEENIPRPKGVNIIHDLINDSTFMSLCKVNDMICKSQGFDQPEGDACRVIHEVMY